MTNDETSAPVDDVEIADDETVADDEPTTDESDEDAPA